MSRDLVILVGIMVVSSIRVSFDLSDTHKVGMEPGKLWRSLNDPAVLQACIGGCRRAERESPGNFVLHFTLWLGPIRRKLPTHVQVIGTDPPARYRLLARLLDQEGDTASGTADVHLSALQGGCTRLSYMVRAEVSGWAALLGERVLVRAARRRMKRFLCRLEQWDRSG